MKEEGQDQDKKGPEETIIMKIMEETTEGIILEKEGSTEIISIEIGITGTTEISERRAEGKAKMMNN